MRCFHLNKGGPTGPATVLLALLLMLPAAGFAGDVDNETCAACHEDVVQAFPATAHGRYMNDRPGLSEFSCEACHGSGLRHVEDGDPALILNPAGGDQFVSQLCLDCHKGDKFDGWMFSRHNSADINCASCHTVHQAVEAVMPSSPDLCYTCHSDVRAAASMPSHHPIAEGQVSCIDCHNPHGSRATLSLDDSNRELCFRCHADIEGPFVYEHAPVNEDCMICHQPHGAVADKLLKLTEPALCLNCHAMHFHATVNSDPDTFVDPQATERNGRSSLDSFKKGMLTKCTQCHTMVHGSDLPSQAASTGGNALTR